MISPDLLPRAVTTQHRAKLACVYIRQSTLSQVARHGESTELQYRLAERAVQLGWPPDRVVTIDEDLGKSGASAQERLGFQRLMAEIGLGRVGLVISLDASRLARNNSDWYRLLEMCSLFGTLIADAERLYDPSTYHDRLLLGLSGMMSEAELHHLKLRLHAGERCKAERGELRLPMPVGLVWPRTGQVMLEPDEEVQARLHLVFAKFRELGSVRGVARYLQKQKLPLPSRPFRGPAPHPLQWQQPKASRVLNLLKNPAYAGAYVYGRSTTLPERRTPGRPNSGTVRLPVDKWPVVLHNRFPAYISWEEFLANQAQIQDNRNRYREGNRGVPRKGQALLQGIALCGRCGLRMSVGYSGPHGEYPVYTCDHVKREYGGSLCQEVRALRLDQEVEGLVLEALAPDKIAIAVAALEHLEQEDAALRRQWDLRLDRAAYEAQRARRQYDGVEPENRLVARSLERQWEEKLREQEKLKQEYEQWHSRHHLDLVAEDRQALLALGEDLPALWRAPSTTAADRKQLLRLIIKEVILDQKRARGRVWFQINWQTGATTQHWINRRVHSYQEYAELEALGQRVRELLAQEKMDKEIAEILNAEGFRTAHGRPFTGKLLWLLRAQWELAAVNPGDFNPRRWEDGSYSVAGVARAVGVTAGAVYQWLRTGRLQGHQPGKGTPWRIGLTDEQIASLADRVRKARRRKGSKQEAS